jgi:hypothetical protein
VKKLDFKFTLTMAAYDLSAATVDRAGGLSGFKQPEHARLPPSA